MPNHEEVSSDLTIIGGGPGGYVAALRAAHLGGRVALVEMDAVGGCCLNRGCIPTKALLRSTEVLDLARSAKEFGVQAGEAQADFAAMQDRSRRVVGQLVKSIEHLLASRQVTLVRGRAQFTAPDALAVETADGVLAVRSPKMLICTGAVPARPPIPGADGAGVFTSDEAVRMTEAPRSVVVIGAGAVGAEWAFIYHSVGAKVTVIEMLGHVLPLEDAEIVEDLGRAMRRRRIDVFTSAKVDEIRDAAEGKEVVFTVNGETKTVAAEQVMMATGRVPYTEGLGLETIGVEMNRRAIKVNDRMETNVPGVYAAGDVVGGIQLAHVASREGEIAVINALSGNEAMQYDAIPSCTFTRPEVSSVGLTEAEARERGSDPKVGRFAFRGLGKAQTMGERDGMVKIVADADSDVVLGVHICGPHATDLIGEGVLAVQQKITARELAEVIHAHPTLPEAVLEAVADVHGAAIHK
jgi:dihydrolipoamide dehydrogenase